MPFDFDRPANLSRDRRLRRRLLSTLHAARISPMGGLSGTALAEIVDAAMPPDQRLRDADHAIGLLRDLVAKGLATETDQRTRKSQSFAIDWMFFKITASGSSLIQESIPPDPDIDDDRLPVQGGN